MDFSIPQPPVTYAVHIFHTFVRVYLTVHQPINFIHNLTPEQISQAFIDHSLRARNILLQLYGLFQPLVVNYPFQQQALEAAYYHAVQAIHTKFGTTPIPPSTIFYQQLQHGQQQQQQQQQRPLQSSHDL